MSMHIKNRTNPQKGFTLIELLVVIAIIGILASVVLASLNTARAKGANAAVKSNLNNIRAQAEIVYDNNVPNGYTGSTKNVCTTTGAGQDSNVARGVAAAATAGGGVGVCNDTAIAWAAGTALKAAEAGNGFWCVDSTGSAKGEPAALGAATVCP